MWYDEMDQLKSAKGDVIMTVDLESVDDCCSLRELLFLWLGPLMDGPVMMRLVSPRETLTQLESTNRVRSEFPDIWLWTILKIGYRKWISTVSFLLKKLVKSILLTY